MPSEPPDPGIVQSFILAMNSGTWNNDAVVLSGHREFPAAVASTTWPTVGQWAFRPTGLLIAEATHDAFRGASANADGSVTLADNTRYYLAAQNGWAVLVAAA